MSTVEQRRRPRNWREWLELGAMIVAVLLMAWGVYLLKQTESQLGDDYVFIVESCVRLNIARAEDNISHYADYKIDKIFYTLTLRQEARIHPTGAQKQAYDQFLVPITEAIHAKSWTPLTDCTKAVNKNGARYKPPQPVHFLSKTGKERLPPAYDLHPPFNSPAFDIEGASLSPLTK